jgi:hypothetical protein
VRTVELPCQQIQLPSSTDLPEGWVTKSLEDVGRWSTGGTASRKVTKYLEARFLA